jgi:hypothetical protein
MQLTDSAFAGRDPVVANNSMIAAANVDSIFLVFLSMLRSYRAAPRGMQCNHLRGALRASSLYRARFCSKAHLDVEIDQHGSLSLVIEECRPFIISPS